MTWTAIIIIAVLVCICIAISEAGDDQAKSSAAALEQQRQDSIAHQGRAERERREQFAARRPEALSQLFKEEFPNFRDAFTYGRCQQVLNWYGNRGEEAARAANMNEPARADRLLGMLFAREVAPLFSEEFTKFAESEPEKVWRIFTMCLEASAVRAQG